MSIALWGGLRDVKPFGGEADIVPLFAQPALRYLPPMRFNLLLLLTPLIVAASSAVVDTADGTTGLLVPRFASIKSDKAYLRTGPGDRYPIAFIYVRAGLPIEIIREYGIWRQLRDVDGTVGWMNKSLLKGERTALVIGDNVRTLYTSADLQSSIAWRIEPRTLVRLTLCDQAWCRVDRGGKSGFILRSQLWGVYPNEVLH